MAGRCGARISATPPIRTFTPGPQTDDIEFLSQENSFFSFGHGVALPKISYCFICFISKSYKLISATCATGTIEASSISTPERLNQPDGNHKHAKVALKRRAEQSSPTLSVTINCFSTLAPFRGFQFTKENRQASTLSGIFPVLASLSDIFGRNSPANFLIAWAYLL